MRIIKYCVPLIPTLIPTVITDPDYGLDDYLFDSVGIQDLQ